MATKALTYRIRDGDKLDQKALNGRFLDIDLRLATLEELKVNWAAAVLEVQNHGIERIDHTIRPILEEIIVQAAEVQRVVDEVTALVTEPEMHRAISKALEAPSETSYAYDAQDRLITFTEIIGGVPRITLHTYDATGRLEKTETTWGSKQCTETYTYDEHGKLMRTVATGALV